MTKQKTDIVSGFKTRRALSKQSKKAIDLGKDTDYLKQAHTPTPWTLDQLISMSDGTLTKEDASFIIRACNSHEELLEACKSMIPMCCGGGFSIAKPHADGCLIGKAISKAEAIQ